MYCRAMACRMTNCMRDANACLVQKGFHVKSNDALTLARAYSTWWQQWQQQHQKKQDIYYLLTYMQFLAYFHAGVA